jgi:hypothetical protein
MLDPATVFVATPVFDGKPEAHYCGGMIQCAFMRLFHTNHFLVGESNIALARNRIAHHFIHKTTYEWLVMIDADIGFSYQDFTLLMEGDEQIVTAEYARKEPQRRPVRFGCGFVRVNRSVFQALDNLNTEDGAERLQRFYQEGEVYVDYFICGATGDARWLGEDSGFWELVKLAGITPRIETRTHLVHWGKAPYPYQSVNDFAAQ